MAVFRRASQVALIGNIAFLGCVLLRYEAFMYNETLTSLLLILGWVMGLWINVGVNIWAIILLCRRRLSLVAVPQWLLWTNAVLLMVEVYYYFFI